MIIKVISFLRDHMPLVLKLCYIVLAALVIWDVAFVDKEHADTFMEKIPGFWALFGFVSCVLIIFVSKWFGHLGIMTREDYYDK